MDNGIFVNKQQHGVMMWEIEKKLVIKDIVIVI